MKLDSILLSNWWRYRILYPWLSRLPRRIAYRVAGRLGRWVAQIHPLRAAVAHGMGAVFPDLHQDPARFADYLVRYYQFQSRDVLDCFVMPTLTPANLNGFLRVNNPEVLDQARSEGKGVILAIGHYGRYFMLGPALQFLGHSFGLLTTELSDDNPHYDRDELWYVRTKLQHGHDFCRGTWVTMDGDHRRIYRALQSGETMLIAFDGLETNSRARLTFPFLGGTLSLPEGVSRIMAKTGAKMVYASTRENGYGLEMTLHALPDEPLESLAAAVSLLERDVAACPWLWLQWTAIGALWTPPATV